MAHNFSELIVGVGGGSGAKVAFDSVKADARRPPHSMFGRVSDRPRVALPGPAGLVVQAGCTKQVVLSPQRMMGGPFWLGLTNAEHLVVCDLRFGQECVFNARGEIPGAFFDARRPERLIPISARCLAPGCCVVVELRNPGCCAVSTEIALWGTDLDDCADAPPQQLYRPHRVPVSEAWSALRVCPGLPALESCSVEALQGGACPACGQAMCGFALAERYRRRATSAEDRLIDAQRQIQDAEENERGEQRGRAEQLERERLANTPDGIAARERIAAHERRRDADFRASFCHVLLAGPYEPGDVWETATDES